MNLENLILNLEEKYHNNIMSYCKKINIDCDIVINGKNLNKVDNNISETENSTSNVIEKTNSSESKEIVYSDDYLYRKPWSKLSSVHKIIKLKEFISKLLINDKNEMESLKNNMAKLVHDKTLTKKDKVKYDDANGRVIAIPILTYKNGKYQINHKI